MHSQDLPCISPPFESVIWTFVALHHSSVWIDGNLSESCDRVLDFVGKVYKLQARLSRLFICH